jgi:hypothetical protein
MTIDENFLPVFKVSLLEICFGTDFEERRICVIHTTVETVGIFMARQKILLNALRTGGGLAEFAERLLSKNGGEAFTADHARLGLNNFIGKLLRRCGSHGVDHFNDKKTDQFLQK